LKESIEAKDKGKEIRKVENMTSKQIGRNSAADFEAHTASLHIK
jgi:hypothetical protein